ncbi:MAG: hypothetical protein JSS87_04665 [Acidobacteria bacterium]|nr:hypothetical protein [Acidobacteriota bacterium]
MASQTITVTLSEQIAHKVHERVISGEYSSDSEAVHELLQRAIDEEGFPLQPWMVAEIKETIARLDSGEEKTLSLEEVEHALRQRRLLD